MRMVAICFCLAWLIGLNCQPGNSHISTMGVFQALVDLHWSFGKGLGSPAVLSEDLAVTADSSINQNA